MQSLKSIFLTAFLAGISASAFANCSTGGPSGKQNCSHTSSQVGNSVSTGRIGEEPIFSAKTPQKARKQVQKRQVRKAVQHSRSAHEIGNPNADVNAEIVIDRHSCQDEPFLHHSCNSYDRSHRNFHDLSVVANEAIPANRYVHPVKVEIGIPSISTNETEGAGPATDVGTLAKNTEPATKPTLIQFAPFKERSWSDVWALLKAKIGLGDESPLQTARAPTSAFYDTYVALDTEHSK